MTLVALCVLIGFGVYIMTREERTRLIDALAVVYRLGARVVAAGLNLLRRFTAAVAARDRRAFAALGVCAGLLLGAAIHARFAPSFTDIRPEVQRLVAMEQATTASYDAAVAQFRLGALSAEKLSALIKRKVLPQVNGIRLHLKSLDRVPDEHKPLLIRAEEYLTLRTESWRLRADALEQHSMRALRKAEQAERISLEAFERVRRDVPSDH